MRTTVSITLLVLAVASCGRANPEPVDVPLAVSVDLRSEPDEDCTGPWRCRLNFDLDIVNGGEPGYYEYHCELIALDERRRLVVRADLEPAMGSGALTGRGMPLSIMPTLGWNHAITRAERASIASLAAGCSAYLWHEPVPD